MKVVVVSQVLGVATYRGKLKALSCLGEIEAIVPDRVEDPAGYGALLHRMPVLSFGHLQLKWFVGVGPRLTASNPDLVHIEEEPFSLSGWQAALAAHRRGIPYVFFTWQNIEKRYPWPIGAMERFVMRGASGAIAGNDEAREILLKKGFSAPIVVIPQFGVDAEVFHPNGTSPDLRRQLGLGGKFVVGYAGRLVPEKGLDMLVAAVKKMGPDVRLLLVGSGAWKPPADPFIVWTPAVESMSMPRWLRAMDVLVLPSVARPNWKEQFGRVLVEAMACGVPVVGSTSGEIPKVIADAGETFPEGDEAALLKTLSELWHRPRRRAELAGRGRKRVLAHFTHDRIATQTADFYKICLSNPRS